MENETALQSYKAEQAFKGASGWFWWIGAMSLVNSGLSMAGKDFTFIFGLGLSQIGDALMANKNPILETLGLFVAVGFASLFLFLAWVAKHWEPAIVTGLVVYACDAVIFAFAQDWLSVGFHAFAFFLILTGYRQYRQLRQAPAVIPAADASAPSPVPSAESTPPSQTSAAL